MGGGGIWGSILGTVFVVLFFGCCIRHFCPHVCRRDYDPYSMTTCYLCLMEIPDGQWYDGSHRRLCALNNSRKLNAMAKSDTESCPKCGDKLRKWPMQGPEVRIHLLFNHLGLREYAYHPKRYTGNNNTLQFALKILKDFLLSAKA